MILDVCKRKQFLIVVFSYFVLLFNSSAEVLMAKDVLKWTFSDSILCLSEEGYAQLIRTDGEKIGEPCIAFKFKTNDNTIILPSKVEEIRAVQRKDGISTVFFEVVFENGCRAEYKADAQLDCVNFTLLSLRNISLETIQEYSIFSMNVPIEYPLWNWWTNTVSTPDEHYIGIMTTSINVKPWAHTLGSSQGNQDGCGHTFRQIARDGSVTKDASVAEFCAESTLSDNTGWTYRGKYFSKSLNLTGCSKLRTRIFGDGKGEALKIQLGGREGHRDDYITIDFCGWKDFELTSPVLNDLSYDNVDYLFFYYNGLPADSSVRCLIDYVEAVIDEGTPQERVILLEDFASTELPYWDCNSQELTARSFSQHSLFPASCAVLATSKEKWAQTVESLQLMVGIPSPHLANKWRGSSPYVHQSYFFLTSFSANEYEQALDLIKRGGFKQVILDQGSWCKSTGHYEINKDHFPSGLEILREIANNFEAQGIRFGLHLLGASVDSDDSYITPIPDKRFVTDVVGILDRDMSGQNDDSTIHLLANDNLFPCNEDSYMGSGQVVRIDDELISYEESRTDGLYKCSRGLYGTNIVPHKKGTLVKHFTRAYGYHLPDLDTDFIDEIASNFAKVANQLPLSMIYFDGSELLQRPGEGDQLWYYNARLHKAFYDRLDNKNLLFQASSCSPYSWNMIPRNASADGHDDLKAYLEERSGWFDPEHSAETYLDVGWYYAYDRNATPDAYEYCLGATLGYDASFSFQTSVSAALQHPFIYDVLDLIKSYEELRLSKSLSKEFREHFLIDSALVGVKSVEERDALLSKRKEFHLEKDENGNISFRRVIYPTWQNVGCSESNDGGMTRSEAVQEGKAYIWKLTVDVPCRIGLQVHFKEEGEENDVSKVLDPQIELYRDDVPDKVVGKISTNGALTRGEYLFALPGETQKVYGKPTIEDTTCGTSIPDVYLKPGVYYVKFIAQRDVELPLRVRTPLYTDEIFAIPQE